MTTTTHATARCWHCYAEVDEEYLCCDDPADTLCPECRNALRTSEYCPDCDVHLLDRNPDHTVD